MPAHDWSPVEAGIFHHFHHSWIEEIQRTLNAGILPAEYYALAEQRAPQLGPDVLTLQVADPDGGEGLSDAHAGNGGVLLAPPKKPFTAETDISAYLRKQDRVAIRHVSDDKVIAIVEVVSPGNKSGRGALREFVEKAAEFLHSNVHLLVLDVLAPGPLDPHGMHAAIWDNLTFDEYRLPPKKSLTLASYESGGGIRCIVEHFAVGDELPDMPLFLKYNGQVPVPVERTYASAFAALPRRWQRVLQP